MAIFYYPNPQDLSNIRELLRIFGIASGLVTNLSKNSTTPIRCCPDDIQAICDELPCPTTELPIKYLGLLLPMCKLPSTTLQPLRDRLRKELPTWKAGLLGKDGHLLPVWHVFSAISYTLMSISMDATTLKLADRTRRGFLWFGRKDANVGHYSMNWQRVCRTIHLGGLEIHDFRHMGIALHAR